jgi:hypothetical protein
MMWIILGFILAFSALALESFDKLGNVKILKVLPDNIVLINRGLEDGISRHDHAKISHDLNGYSSRAICLKASSELSYWKIYRVPHSEAFSMDNVYVLSGISEKEIPRRTSLWIEKEGEFIEPKEKIKPVTGTDPFSLSSDLPEKLTERDLIEPVGLDKRKLYLEQSWNQEQLKKDLSSYNLSVFASPFMRQSINQAESLRYGFKGSNFASKYRLLTQFEQQQTQIKDPLTKETVKTRGTNGQLQFVIHQLTPSLSSLSLINYNSQQFSDLGTPSSHWQVGVLGFTWHMYDSKTWEYMDFSYIPLYDIRKTDMIKNGQITEDSKSGLRHGFRFGIKSRINERVAFENLLWVRPYQDLASWMIETDNLNLSNDLKFIVSLTSNLFFDYNLIYQKDKIWKTKSGLPDSNTINSLNLRYEFNL